MSKSDTTTQEARLSVSVGGMSFSATGTQEFISQAIALWLRQIMDCAPRKMVEGDLYAGI
jgi:hypothetical protein